jgi:PLP dependent protein
MYCLYTSFHKASRFVWFYTAFFYYFYPMHIAENICRLKEKISAKVSVIAVSKTISEEGILEAYQSGQKIFGENRVQDLVKKQALLPSDIEWHMIGHLQTNKVKYIAPFVCLIHSVDNLKLLSVINQEALRNRRIIPCLLQIRIAKEETKYGLTMDDARDILSSPELSSLRNIQIKGFMGMATYTDDHSVIRAEFRSLTEFFKRMKITYFPYDDSFCELSMGMSGDYEIAIEEGATMLRIGTLIFGSRIYTP